MTAGELEVELGCYKMYFNERCDIHNLTMRKLADFIMIRDALPNEAVLNNIKDV